MKRRRSALPLRMPILWSERSISALVLWVGILSSPEPVHGFFLRSLFGACGDAVERCGLLGLSMWMHRGAVGSSECRSYCVWFYSSDLECGDCQVIGNEMQPTAGYDMYLDLVNIPTNNTSYFSAARNRWQAVITGDLPDVRNTSLKYRPSLKSGCVLPAVVDDVYICATYQPIDGARQVLGSAGPTEIRAANLLTVAGEMRFDTADIAYLQTERHFSTVITHEMAHILGIGSLWVTTGVTGSWSIRCPYRGPQANAEFVQLSGCNKSVPTENDGDPASGTFCGHWDEACLNAELMTGVLNRVDDIPLSRITIAALYDLGYTVSYRTAETFTKSDLATTCQCAPKRRRSMMNLFHGEIRQLGVESSRRPRRRLSDAAHQIAMEYGKNVLSQRAQSMASSSLLASLESSAEDTATIYVGDQFLSVLVEDGGEVYGVIVTNQ
jgi:Leishmanolysin